MALPVITYASEAWCTSISKKAKGKLCAAKYVTEIRAAKCWVHL